MAAQGRPPPELTGSFRVFLIVDVRGYTRFTQAEGSSGAARLAMKLADVARDAVSARGGRVFELRGDEVVAVFESVPQAIRAAVELQAACAEELAAEPGLPLHVGAGIAAGEVVPVEDGFRGAALNVAARLCSAAAAGEVLLRRDLAAAVMAGEVDFAFEPHDSLQLKGIDEPVEVVRAVALPSTVRTDAHPAAPTETTLVERDEDLHWLRGTWRASRRGRGRIVFVSGPSGIGKTQLAEDLVELAAASGDELIRVSGGGDAAARAARAIEAAAAARRPTVVVLDEIEPIADVVAGHLEATFDSIEALPALVVVLAIDPLASTGLAELVERADIRGDGHRRLRPLTIAGVTEVAAAYAGDELDAVPLDAVMHDSGGVPARVHRALLEWARTEAARRLAAAAEWLADGRSRRAGDLEFANNVIRLRLERLYDIPDASGGERACPYKGLAPFGEDDADVFFGREQLVGELAARTVGFGLLAVVGASGSGKSSVVRAGLVPSLAAGLLPGSDRWAHVVVRPGEHPLTGLDAALAHAPGGERLVVVVDQFEETFSVCADEAERSAFVARIVELASDPERNAVVLTIRDDFYGHCAPYAGLAAPLAANHVLVPPMTRDELRRACDLPARRSGVRLEPALLDALVNGASDEAGSLPLLSTLLVELWRAREGGWITADAYRRTGGISGAVARLAEESFGRLDAPQQEAARKVLLRLAGGEDGDAITRRRVSVSELDLDHDPQAAAAVARLTDDRLLTAGESTIEVAHEALLREWPRLRGWLDEDAEGRRLRLHLIQAAAQWAEAGRNPGELYRGPRLAATIDWTADHGRELNNLEREFVAASRAASEEEARRQRRSNRRLRGLLAAAVVLLAAAAIAGVVALAQRGHARRSATTAEAQRLGAQALTVTPPDQSFLYARESYNLEPSPATRGYLFAAQSRSPAAIAVLHPVAERIHAVLASPDRSRQLVFSNSSQAAIVDAATLVVQRRFPTSPGPVAWAGNDRVMYVDPRTRKLGFMDLASGRFAPDPRLPGDAYVVSNDGRELFTLSTGASVGIVDLRTMRKLGRVVPSRGFHFYDVEPEQGGVVAGVEVSAKNDPHVPTRYAFWLHGFRGPPTRVVEVRLRPGLPWAVGGRRFATIVPGGVEVVDLQTGRSTVIARDVGAVNTLGLSPDGKTLVVATVEHSDVSVIRVADGTVEDTFVGHQSQVHGVTFDPTGGVVFTAGADGRFIAWDLLGTHSLSTTRVLAGTTPNPDTTLPAGRLLASSSGARLVAAALGDGTVRLVAATSPSLTPVRTIRITPPGRPGQPTSVALDPGGRQLAVGTDDGRILVFDTTSGRRLAVRLLHAKQPPEIVSVAFSKTGLLAAATSDGRVLRFAAPGLRTLPVLRSPHGTTLTAIAFSPSGGSLALVFSDESTGTIAVDDAATGARRYAVTLGPSVLTAAFTPDGSTLIGGDGDGLAHFWNASDGRAEGSPILVNQGDVNSLAVDSTGHTLLAAGTDGATWLFDLATRTQIGTPLGADASTTTAALFVGRGDVAPLTLALPDPGLGMPSLTRWDLRAGFLAARACTVAHRNLTRLEWQQILPNRPYAKVCPGYPLSG